MDAMPQDAPEGSPQDAQESPEDMIIDQIGALLQKLSPEKQKEVVDQLGQLISGAADQGAGAPEAGMQGTPAERV